MEPETVAARRPAASNRLEKISKREVIVVVPPETGGDVIRPGLRCFERRENIGRELVHNITGITEIAADTVGHQVRGAIFLLAAEEMEGQAACGEQRKLAPAARRVDRNDAATGQHGEALAHGAKTGVVRAPEPGAGDFKEARRLHQPVHREQARIDGLPVDVRGAEVKAGREFDATRFAAAIEEEAAFIAGALAFERDWGRGSGHDFRGFVDTGLRAESHRIAAETALHANLWLPVPQVAGAGQWREPHLRERHRLPRRNDRLVLADGNRVVLPREIDRREAHPEKIVVRGGTPAPEIEIGGAAGLAAAGEIRAVKPEADHGLAESGAGGGGSLIELRGGGHLARAAKSAVVEGVEQQHAGEGYRHALRSFNAGLGEILSAAFENVEALGGSGGGGRCLGLDGLRWRGSGLRWHRRLAGGAQFLAKLVDFRQQLRILFFQAVEPFHHALQIADFLHVTARGGAGLRERQGREARAGKDDSGDSHQHKSCSSLRRTAAGEYGFGKNASAPLSSARCGRRGSLSPEIIRTGSRA